MASVTIPTVEFSRLKENEEILKRLKDKTDFRLYEEVLREMYEEKQEKQVEDFIEFLNDVLAEAEVDYPAGRDCYPRIEINEESVKRYVRNMLENEHV